MIARCVVFAAFVLSAAGMAQGAAPARFIPMLDPGDAIPPLRLVAQDGRAFGLDRLRGYAVVVSFIYTRCRDARMCPLVAAKFARMQGTIGVAKVRLLTITLDPGYDRPAVLARYGRAFGQDPRYWTLATGPQSTIDEFAARLGIATSSTAPGTIAHTEVAVVVAPDGRIARSIGGNTWTPAQLLDAARATLDGSPEPFAPLRTWLDSALERCGGGAIGLNGSQMLAIFALALGLAGYVFWRAFRPGHAHRAAPKT